MTIEIKFTYEDENELHEAMKQREIDRAARRVLEELRKEMRSVCRHEKPTDRDEYWYDRLFELAKEEDVSGWDF